MTELPPILPARRQPLHPELNEELVADLVITFYGRVRDHETLGPVFKAALGADWRPHLEKMCAFWSSVVLKTGRYSGKPMVAHAMLNEMTPDMFDEWLLLFRETAKDLYAEDIAAVFIQRAEMIAESLQMGLFFKGRIAPGQAFDAGHMTDGGKAVATPHVPLKKNG